MTKQHYFEMCVALNSSIIEDEVPVEYGDLPELVQLALSIHDSLRDEWDYMGGNYIGKSLTNLFEIFDLYNIIGEEKLLVYKIISMVDNERRIVIRSKNKNS